MAAVLLGVVTGQTARETARRRNMDVGLVEKRVRQLRTMLGAGNASSFLHAALDVGFLKVVGPQPKEQPHISPRQWEVLRLLDQGKENDEIAEELGIRETTVRSHLRLIAEALNARRRTEIVAAAYCWGMLK